MWQRRVTVVFCLLLAVATLRRLKAGGAPFLSRPPTVIDHVGPKVHEIRPALLLLPNVAQAIPRGAEVACLRPEKGALADDIAFYHTAVAMLPEHRVRRATARPQYVIAVGSSLDDPVYVEAGQYEEGTLYRRVPSKQ